MPDDVQRDEGTTPSDPARVLENGLRLRLIRPDDEPRLVTLYGRLSRHTAYQRFFAAMQRLPLDWAHFLANVDYRARLALVVEDPRGGELIAVGRYEPSDQADVAEVAFVVQDAWQGKGLGRLLLRELLLAAEARGIRRFRAYVLADNDRMLRLLSRDTRILERRIESGVVALMFERRE
jgi:RimJ/RimL family protein N-acetyltransferase